MSEKKETSTTLKRSWFQEMKAEFGKISWLNRAALIKQSVAVIVSSVIIGLVIAGVDIAFAYLLEFVLVK